MKPTVQTRLGKTGNCFAACLASILETPIPEFGEGSGYWKRVSNYLATHGLRYVRTSLHKQPPRSVWHTVEGISPRGGLHAVVGHGGKEVFDPHPEWDDPRRGLAKPMYYGLLLPLKRPAKDLGPSDILRKEPKDVTQLREIVGNYAESHRLSPADQEILDLLRKWTARLEEATRKRGAKDRADMLALRRNTERQGGPFHVQLTEPDGAEHTTSVHALRAYDELLPVPPFQAGDTIKLPNGKRTRVKAVNMGEDLFHNREWHVLTVTGEAIVLPIK